MKRTFVLAITGASGAAYAVRLLEVLLGAGSSVHLTISAAARDVLKHELDLDVDLDDFRPEMILPSRRGRLSYHHFRKYLAAIASGSFPTDGMVICPCSSGTLSAIVHGNGTNLIHRAAEVHLKERRKLILVPRETPLSIVQLENLHRAAEAGAVILPAMPGFYHGAQTVQDLVDFVVARICDQLGVENDLIRRWGSDE
jgi:4-hydroxy-3-polyprenylbenzoate decarboxylase